MSFESERPLVLVDARMARRRPVSGTATYIRGLERGITDADPRDLRVEFRSGPPGFPRRGAVTSVGNAALDLLWTHLMLPVVARARGAALLHGASHWRAWWSPVPTVVTVQDLIWERPEARDSRRFRWYARIFTRRAARRSRFVVVPSQATADDVASRYGVERARCRVIPLAVGPADGERTPREAMILAVGIDAPRKRIAELIRAHARYAATVDDPCRLVLAGAPGPQARELRSVAGPLVTFTGRLSETALADHYRRARLVVVASAYEGFGLPVLEAMSFGCPVLAARNSSLTEVGGDVARYVDDVAEAPFAQRIADVLAEPDLDAIGERGRGWAATFTWERTARGTLDVYREALAP
ncbi:MAG: glycosyltransferase family 4 protein [Actinobacteria bacterium]|nr:glycosyltransferase family 4 protein [Actinomycetota bacterium]